MRRSTTRIVRYSNCVRVAGECVGHNSRCVRGRGFADTVERPRGDTPPKSLLFSSWRITANDLPSRQTFSKRRSRQGLGSGLRNRDLLPVITTDLPSYGRPRINAASPTRPQPSALPRVRRLVILSYSSLIGLVSMRVGHSWPLRKDKYRYSGVSMLAHGRPPHGHARIFRM